MQTIDRTSVFFHQLLRDTLEDHDADQKLRREHERRMTMLSSQESQKQQQQQQHSKIDVVSKVPAPPVPLDFASFPGYNAWRRRRALELEQQQPALTVHAYLTDKLRWSVEVARARPRARRAIESEESYVDAFEAWYTERLGAVQNPMELEDFIREHALFDQTQAQALEAWQRYTELFAERTNAWVTRFSDLHTELLLDDLERRYLEQLGDADSCETTFQDAEDWDRGRQTENPRASYNAARRRWLNDNYAERYAMMLRSRRKRAASRSISATRVAPATKKKTPLPQSIGKKRRPDVGSEDDVPDARSHREEEEEEKEEEEEWTGEEFPLLDEEERVPFMRRGMRLMRHQMHGLSFGVHREQNPVRGVRGGMFLYRQGLGKTPMTLALVARDAMHMQQQQQQHSYLAGDRIAATLVVVCKSVLGTWCDEFLKFFGDQPGFRHMVFHGSEFSHGMRLRDVGVDHLLGRRPLVIVTTYETVRSGADHYRSLCQDHHARGAPGSFSSPPPLHAVRGPALLHALHWRRKVADESQRFANEASRLSRAMCRLRAERAWCLTGTPIRNRSADLLPQLEFVGMRTRQVSESDRRDATRRVVLHLDYEDTDVHMPELRVRTVRVSLDEQEKRVYEHYLGATRRALRLYDEASKHSVHFFAVLTQLRIACVSTHLLCVGRSRDGRDRIQREHVRRQQHQMNISDFFSRSSSSPPPASSPPPSSSPRSSSPASSSSPVSSGARRSTLSAGAPPKIRTLDLSQVNQLRRRKRSELRWNLHSPARSPPPQQRREQETEEQQQQQQTEQDEPSNMQQIFDDLPEECRAFVARSQPDSSKIREIRRIVSDCVPEDEKFIVFSNFASALPLMHDALRRDGVRTLSICGKIGRRERDEIRRQFDADPGIRGLLLTYGAGGLGLTLVAANHVLLADPWWAGEREEQAMSRAYRIGQRRVVNVYRLLVQDSVESRMREVASRKEDELEAFLGIHRAIITRGGGSKRRKIDCKKKSITGKELARALVG